MTDPLNAVAQAKAQRTDAEAKFVAAIVDASESGYPYRVIAKAAGLSFQRVAQIATAPRTPVKGKGKVTA